MQAGRELVMIYHSGVDCRVDADPGFRLPRIRSAASRPYLVFVWQGWMLSPLSGRGVVVEWQLLADSSVWSE
jgi:hypothetical protein